MTIRYSSALALVCAGLMGACDGTNTGSSPDMTSTTPDMTGAQAINGCNTSDYVDRTSATSIRTVSFPGTGLAYNPRCMTVAVGQMVTFSGDFASHPLRPGVGANATAGSANNPITVTNTGATKTFTFSAAGTYPYNCQTYDGSGMNGVIKVQ